MRNKNLKKAFSMLEMVLVIAILGIVASVGSSIIADVYENYIIQRSLHKSSLKTELVSSQIANRLTYRISGSVIGKKTDGSFLPVNEIAGGTAYVILEWIGYDNDSFSAQNKPAWSGFCDVNDPTITRTNILTPGSTPSLVSTYIGRLGGAGITDAAIIFAGGEYSSTVNYRAGCMGFDRTSGTADTSCISRITASTDTPPVFTLNDNRAKVIKDQYKLAWSAYAIVPENYDATDETFDLRLYYNYQPWLNEQYSDGSSSLLATNVTTFKFMGRGDTIRFKICAKEKTGFDDGNFLGVCKEKAVIR